MNFLSPVFNEQTFDANGNPLVGGKVYTYAAGTSTPLQTYTTQNGTTQQANPIILDARGEPPNPIWLLGSGQEYKFQLHDANDNLIRTIDDVGGVNDVTASGDEWVTSALTPTYISATSFSFAGDQTLTFLVGRRIRTANTGGTTYSLITSSVFGVGITTITVTNDSGVLDSGLSIVAYGILSPSNPSVPNSTSVRDALGITVGVQVFDTPGSFTYTATSGTRFVVVEVQGAGGGSGYTNNTAGGQSSAVGGGASGSYAKSRITSGFSGSSVVVGAGGTAGTNLSGNGGTGGQSSFGTVVAAGGPGSPAGTPAAAPFFGGAGAAPATPSVGNILKVKGGYGAYGIAISNTIVAGGDGGTSFFGSGGIGNTNGVGVAGVAYGSGAGGPSRSELLTGVNGAAGASGIVIVWEYA